MSSLTHSRVKMTSAGGNLQVCSIYQVLSSSFHKHFCPNVVMLLSQCILLQQSSKGNWNISELMYVTRLSAVFSTKKIDAQGILRRMSQILQH